MEPVDITAHQVMDPYKVLSMNIDPALEATKAAGDRAVAMRNWRLQNATEFAQKQALQSQQLQAARDIAQWHEKVANIREDTQNAIWDKRIQAQAAAAAAAERSRIEGLNADELDREARGLATGQTDQKTGLYIPPIARLPGESTQDYVVRAGTERAKADAQRQGLIDKNTALLTGRINSLLTNSEQQNQAAAHAAGIGGVADFLSSRLNPAMRQQFQAGVQRLTSAGVSYPNALSQMERVNPAFVGVSDAYTQKYAPTLLGARALKSPIMETQLDSLGGLLKNPAALARDDFGDMLNDHPSTQVSKMFTLSPNAGPGGPNPAVASARPQSVLSLTTGIPSVDDAVKSQQLQSLGAQREAIAAKLAGVNRNIGQTADPSYNPVVTTYPSFPTGPGAAMTGSAPMFPDAISRAHAVLGLQSQLAPLQQQLAGVNSQSAALAGDDFQ